MSAPMTHAHAPQKKNRALRIALIVLASLAAIMLAGVLALVLVGKNVADTYDASVTVMQETFPEETNRPPAATDGSQTILLLGSDTRGTIDHDDIDGGQDGRSDSMMVMRIPGDRDGVYVMSIMRDSWVNIPGHGYAKVNAAMAYGGIPLTVETVEDLLGTRIDRVALIDFEGFKGLTDALGGVTVKNETAFSTRSSNGGMTFEAGNIHLNGEEALAFVRERKAFAEGDYRRVKNQQAFLKSAMQTFISRGTLTSPAKVQEAVGAIGEYMVVDEGFTSGYIIGLLPSMADVRSSDFTFFTLPTAGVSTSPDGQSIIELDPERMALLRQAFQDDTLGEYVATQDLNSY